MNLLVLIAYFVPQWIASFLGYFLFISTNGNEKKIIPKSLLYFFYISLICFFCGLFWNNIDYYFFRTLYYYVQFIGIFLLGVFFINYLGFEKFIRSLVYSGFIITLIYFSEFFVSLDWMLSPFSIENRYKYGLNSDYAVISVAILITSKLKFNRLLFFTLCFLIVLSLSRTNILLLLLIIIIKYLGKYRFSLFLIFVSIFSFVLINFDSTSVQNFSAENYNFQNKILNSLTEILPQDQDELALINENYRGFEAFIGIKSVVDNGVFNIIFGNGAGATVSIDAFATKAQNMSFFHNGFVTIFFHAGIIGLILYFLFIYTIYSKMKMIDKSSALIIVSVIMITTLTIMGFISPIPNIFLIFYLSIILFSKKFLNAN